MSLTASETVPTIAVGDTGVELLLDEHNELCDYFCDIGLLPESETTVPAAIIFLSRSGRLLYSWCNTTASPPVSPSSPPSPRAGGSSDYFSAADAPSGALPTPSSLNDHHSKGHSHQNNSASSGKTAPPPDTVWKSLRRTLAEQEGVILASFGSVRDSTLHRSRLVRLLQPLLPKKSAAAKKQPAVSTLDKRPNPIYS